ncbi:leucine-rich repeat-containing protein 39-like [Drosophila ananassae]|uniref:leucine-rich repeat-containing protein 39-like n=1 Tax=Drosophila ananassae TaxID=7217 RepID=UPI0013A5E373|nr:leucine-rich repeat-containing protein 39-like [Drosophila ananassae]
MVRAIGIAISGGDEEVSLTVITRHHVLTKVPQELFHLVSLKYLNIAQNRITDLPAPVGKSYSCPVLDEHFLQDNQLTSLPMAIFHLPALTILNVSNNKLQKLPFDLWRAPKLRELMWHSVRAIRANQ